VKFNVNVSIDDVSPHPRSSTKVVDQCYRLIDSFPDIKFTLFVPIAYWRTMRSEIATREPLIISNYPEFCEELKKLPKQNFEIGYHGLFHGIPGKSDNDEFRDLNYERAKLIFDNMFKIVSDANLAETFKPIFRPPAWRMSPDAFRASKDAKMEILALSNIDYAKEVYKKEDESYKHVTYSDIFPPLRDLSLTPKTGIVYHACEWDQNHLNEKKTQELIDFFEKEKENIDFCFQEGIV
tara:strand:+ start:503 stop:1216 length:714 start_codon:yes stop_codon:yes gene_type:complete